MGGRTRKIDWRERRGLLVSDGLAIQLLFVLPSMLFEVFSFRCESLFFFCQLTSIGLFSFEQLNQAEDRLASDGFVTDQQRHSLYSPAVSRVSPSLWLDRSFPCHERFVLISWHCAFVRRPTERRDSWNERRRMKERQICWPVHEFIRKTFASFRIGRWSELVHSIVLVMNDVSSLT